MSMPAWITFDRRVTAEHLGLIPSMLDDEDPAPAREQFDRSYQHGGGWRPFPGHIMGRDYRTLEYPGDPPSHALALTRLRDEIIVLFEHAWVAVIQAKDGTYEVCRMD